MTTVLADPSTVISANGAVIGYEPGVSSAGSTPLGWLREPGRPAARR